LDNEALEKPILYDFAAGAEDAAGEDDAAADEATALAELAAGEVEAVDAGWEHAVPIAAINTTASKIHRIFLFIIWTSINSFT
jgi:hypothetical protein